MKTFATMLAALAATACMAHAAGAQSARITIPAGAARPAPGGAVQFPAAATALVRVRGLAVLVDPDDDPGAKAMRDVDVVLLTQPGRSLAGAWRSTPVVAMPDMAQQLRAQGWRSVYPLDTWEDIMVRKGATRLRMTSLPDVQGGRPATMAAMLDFGPSCRLLVHDTAVPREEIGLLPQRFPGAKLALLRQADTLPRQDSATPRQQNMALPGQDGTSPPRNDGMPLLLSMAGQEARIERAAVRGEPYRFGSPDCN